MMRIQALEMWVAGPDGISESYVGWKAKISLWSCGQDLRKLQMMAGWTPCLKIQKLPSGIGIQDSSVGKATKLTCRERLTPLRRTGAQCQSWFFQHQLGHQRSTSCQGETRLWKAAFLSSPLFGLKAVSFQGQEVDKFIPAEIRFHKSVNDLVI